MIASPSANQASNHTAKSKNSAPPASTLFLSAQALCSLPTPPPRFLRCSERRVNSGVIPVPHFVIPSEPRPRQARFWLVGVGEARNLLFCSSHIHTTRVENHFFR